MNTDFPIETDSLIGDARSCEMLKAYLEQAIRYETGVAEKDALVAYVTRSISNSGTILLCRRLNVEHACCRNLTYLESRAATRDSAR